MTKHLFILLTSFLLLPVFSGSAQDSTSYKKAMAKGDKLFAARNYAKAKKSFTKSLGYFNNAPQAKARVAACDKAIQDEEVYKKCIAGGDRSFAEKKTKEAKAYYSKASRLKPNEIYPKQKLEECNKLLSEIHRKREEDYARFVKVGQEQFDKKNYVDAKKSFQDALAIKPKSDLCKEKIMLCNKRVAPTSALDKQQLYYITQGDSCLAKKDTVNTKLYYAKALKLKDDCQLRAQMATLDKVFVCCSEAQGKHNQKVVCGMIEGEFYMGLKKYKEALAAFKAVLAEDPKNEYAEEEVEELQEEIEEMEKKKK